MIKIKINSKAFTILLMILMLIPSILVKSYILMGFFVGVIIGLMVHKEGE